MVWRIGVDSGGTFTDICLFEEETGRIAVWKVASTPKDPSLALEQGVSDGLAREGAKAEEVAFFSHGTTVATNALIERRVARTGLLTSEGFRDLLEIGRQKRPQLYDLQSDKPPVLVPRHRRREVRERLRHDGATLVALDEKAVREAAQGLKAEAVAAVAICFLYSFVEPRHEKTALGILAEELPGVFLSASHEVAPEFREFERLSTTVVNAALGPIMAAYIEAAERRLKALGIAGPPHMTQSNGGVIGFDGAARLPVRTVLSGPSTGVVGARVVGRLAGAQPVGDIPAGRSAASRGSRSGRMARGLITFDMGGTSTDVALIPAGAGSDGEAPLAGETVVHGYPLQAPMLDIHTIGAGGGSIAFVDRGGLLKVGPESAGADPGPVCYDRGNREPTVTDANVVLQTLNPRSLLGGRMKVRQDLARKAIDRLAKTLGMEALATADGILRVVSANMARAIRVISVERGHDPRDYMLLAFGGAGPLHAARLARELEIGRILVPRHPGILCAMGLLLTDLRADFSATRRLPLSPSVLGEIERVFAELSARAEAWFLSEGVPASSRRRRLAVDMRYAGQNYELSVPLPAGRIEEARIEKLAQGFAAAHRRRYGFVAEEETIELVTFRLEARGIVPKAALRPESLKGEDASAALLGDREVWLEEKGGFCRSLVYDRERLEPGNLIIGPAIIEQMDATTLVLPEMTARVDPYRTLFLAGR
jgi:N-methylhydantoinase A